MKLPQNGSTKEDVYQQLAAYRVDDLPYRSGRAFGLVFDAGKDVEEVQKRAYNEFMGLNALDPTVYPSILRFENDIIAMARAQLGGDDEVVGSFTSGGTESILLAVKTARDYHRKFKPSITQPEMIIPTTAHAAFHKACSYFDVKKVMVEVDSEDFRVRAENIQNALTENTILIVGSAPSYAHGVMDPIAEIAAIAKAADVFFHVDACMGGWLLPYFRRLGRDVPAFDFSLEGVTSISMDLHKYAFCAKGASVVMYRHRGLRKYQLFACSGWTGYTMVNPTVQSTKSAGPLAAAWAVMNFVGDDGYLKLAQDLLTGTEKFVAGIEAIDGIDLMVKPDMTLVAFSSDTISVFALADAMRKRGWYIQPQMGRAPHKENIHLSINPNNVPMVDSFITDLGEAVAELKENKSAGLDPAMKQSLAAIDPDTIDEGVLQQMLGMAGMTGVGLPEQTADINEILNALAPACSEKLLVEFVNQLFTPTR